MAKKTQLEEYLQLKAAGGQVDSIGEFTLVPEKLIITRSKFQLFYESDWALKVVQSIVAGGTSKPININLSVGSIVFSFSEPGFELEELIAAYFKAEPSGSDCLRHLVIALWVVGVGKRWSFQISLPNQEQSLIWDATRLSRVRSSKKTDTASITIVPAQDSSLLFWLDTAMRAASRNSDILKTIERKCYACPVPLTLDGRRLDHLQKTDFRDGFRESDSEYYPVVIGTADPNLPTFGIPPGSYDSKICFKNLILPTIPEDVEVLGWKYFAEQELGAISPRNEATLAYILRLFVRANTYPLDFSHLRSVGYSRLYWVIDGVVVEVEDLVKKPTFCLINCFISGKGLKTDISTLKLVDSIEKNERFRLACLTLEDELAHGGLIDFKRVDKIMEMQARKQSRKLFGLIGSVFLLGIPWGGAFSATLGLMFLGGASLSSFKFRDRCEDDVSVQEQLYGDAIKLLGESLQQKARELGSS